MATSSSIRPGRGIVCPQGRSWLAVVLLLGLTLALPATTPVRAATYSVTVDDATDEIHASGCALDGTTSPCSLRDAILYSNSRPTDAGTINLAATTYTLTLAGANEDNAQTGDLDVKANITMVGQGTGVTVLNANHLDRVLQIFPGFSVTLSGMTLVNGTQTSAGGIQNAGVLTLTNCLVTGNAATSSAGGGLYNDSGGTLILNGTTVSSNSATVGGGLYNRNNGSGTSSVTLTDSTVANNFAQGASTTVGGGIASVNNSSGNANLTLHHTSVTGNTVTTTGSTAASGGIDSDGGASAGGAQIVINGGSTISGNTAIIDAGISSYRSTLIMNNAVVSGNIASRSVGGIDVYGANSTATLTGVTVQNNRANGGNSGGIEIGAGTGNGAVTFTMTGGSVSGNSAGASGGGILVTGQSGKPVTATLSGVSIGGNTAQNGGGIFVIYSGGSSVLNVVNSTVQGNSASNNGGGIDNDGGTIAVTGSTISGNTAPSGFAGGGVLNANETGFFTATGTLTMSNSTVSGNTGGSGGGVANTGTATLTNVTVANNGGTSGGGIQTGGAGSGMTVRNSVIAGNPGGNCAGAITDGHYNLDSGATCGFVDGTDLLNTDPLLGALGNNGGPTQTLALPANSAAVDKIPGTGGCNGANVTTDQRGVTRPQPVGGRCDIGAVEYQVVVNPMPVPRPGGSPVGGADPLPQPRTGGASVGAPNPLPSGRP